MVEDSPQELIFDLVTKAVFGRHPLGRPVLGSAEVISTVSRRSLGAFHRRATGPDNVVVAAAGSVDHDRLVGPRRGHARERRRDPPARKPSARTPFVAPPKPSLVFQPKPTEQYHLCLGGPGHRALRPQALHGVDPRQRPRRLRVVAALPGDPREARARLRRLHVLLAVRRHRPDRRLRRHAGGEPRRSACGSSPSRSADIAEHGPRPDELERAKENLKGRIMLSMEMTSNRMSRLGKSLITDSELLDLDRILAEIEAVDAEAVAQLAEVLLRAGVALRRRHRAERGAAPRGGRAGLPGARGARRRVKVLLLGAGRQGRLRARAAPARGRRPRRHAGLARRAWEPAGQDAAVDFTRAGGRARERRAVPGRWRCRPWSARPGSPRRTSPPSTTLAKERARRLLRRAELRARRRPDDAPGGRGGPLPPARRDRRAPRTRRSSTRLRGRQRRPRSCLPGETADPLRASARPRRPPGGALRRATASS